MNSPRHLGNYRKENTHLLRKAAKRTKYKIAIVKPSQPSLNKGYAGVATHEPGRDHGAFWREYERLKAQWENGNWLTRLFMSLFG